MASRSQSAPPQPAPASLTGSSPALASRVALAPPVTAEASAVPTFRLGPTARPGVLFGLSLPRAAVAGVSLATAAGLLLGPGHLGLAVLVLGVGAVLVSGRLGERDLLSWVVPLGHALRSGSLWSGSLWPGSLWPGSLWSGSLWSGSFSPAGIGRADGRSRGLGSRGSRAVRAPASTRNLWRAPLPLGVTPPEEAPSPGDKGPLARRLPAPAFPPEWGHDEWWETTVDGRPVGVVCRDGRRGREGSVALVVEGPGLALLDPAEQAERLRRFGELLQSLAQATPGLLRLQILEVAEPAAGLDDPPDGGDDSSVRVGEADPLADVLAAAARLATHRAVLLVPVVRVQTRGASGVAEVVAALGGIVRRANAAGVASSPLPAAHRAGWCRATVAPLDRTGPLAPRLAGPLARRVHFDRVETDGAIHALFWVAGWPTREVGPAWLSPFLLGRIHGRRVVSVVLEPVAPSRAIAAASRARARMTLDETARIEAGFAVRLRSLAEAEAARQREAELVAGHTALRFGAVVGVSAPDPSSLARATSEMRAAAGQSHLLLQRLYGQADLGLAALAPLGRLRLAEGWAG